MTVLIAHQFRTHTGAFKGIGNSDAPQCANFHRGQLKPFFSVSRRKPTSNLENKFCSRVNQINDAYY